MTVEKAGSRTGDLDAAQRAEQIRQRLLGSTRRTVVIDRVDRGGPLPLSAGQQQMWVLHRLDPASPAYLMAWTLRLVGEVDVEALRWAWERLVHRHEILRTRYGQPGDEPVGYLDPPARFELPVVDLLGEPAAGREEHAVRIAAARRQQPFDLETEHPLRVTLIRVAPARHLLVVVTHHIACDGASYRRIGAEVSAYYAERAAGRPAALPDLPVQYADYAGWERRRVAGDGLRTQLEYWRRHLDGLSELALPTDRPRPARPDWRGGTVEVPVGPELTEQIRRLASARQATPYLVLLAAFQTMLAQLSGHEDVAVGTPVTMHALPELDQLIGYTINTVVVRARCPRDATFAAVLAEVRTAALAALDHREVPFRLLVDELRPARDPGGNPLFQVAFDLNPTEDGVFDLPGVEVTPVGAPERTVAKFDLTVHVEEAPDGRLSAYLEFARALFDEETAQRLAAHYGRLLDTVIREPELRLELLPQPPLPGPTPAAAAQPSASGTAGAEPDAELLATLDEVWRDVLRVDRIEPDDNFFDIGGDSVRAVALAGRLKTRGLDVTAADLFAHQTVEELGRAVALRSRAEVPTGIPPFAMVSPADRDALPTDLADAYPVGAGQLGMIIEMLARPDLNLYQDSTSFLIRGDGPFSASAFERAVQLVVDRHEVLRTTFDLSSYSVPLQLVHREVSYRPGVTRGERLGPEGWEPRLRAYFDERRRNPMSLTEAPLVRFHAHQAAGTDDWCFSVTECHPVLEGWSFHTLMMEILTAYRDFRSGQVPATPEPVPFRYADYIAAELASLRSESDRAYWRGVIEGRSPGKLPTAWRDDPDAARDRYQHSVWFDDLQDALRRLAADTRTSLKAVLLAAHLTVMGAVTEAEDFCTGLVTDARPELVGAERIPGFYINTVPFAMPTGARTWGELVGLVYQGLTEMWPHRRFPMPIVQQEFAPGTRLVEVMFNYLDFHQVDKDLVHWEATVDESENEFALHVFTLAGDRSGVLRLNTTNHVLTRDATRRLGEMYRAVLQDMARGPGGDATAACLPPADARRLAAVRDATALATEPESVPAAFAGWVRSRPDAVAVRSADVQLSYAQLDAAARQVADRLRQVGVRPGGLVAVAPRHDVSLPATLLGIWQAGAAWLALDGRLPPEQRPAAARAAGADALVEATTVTDLRPVTSDGSRAGWPAGPVAAVLPDPRTAPGGGAVLSHRALAYALAGQRAGLAELGSPSTEESVWLFASSFPSWPALTELLLPIVTGGQLVLGPAPAVTHRYATAGEVGSDSAGRVGAGPVVVLAGGDPLLGVARPAATGEGARVVEVGGCDTAPGWLTLAGRPLPGRTPYVLDPQRRAVPIGVLGELYVGGPALADGYHGDPVATAEHFVPAPDGDQRLLRTGHLARFHDDGRLELLGPRRWYRTPDSGLVDLGAIRAALAAHPAVREAYVRLRPAAGDGHQLVAYLRPVPGAAVEPVEIRRTLAGRLPRRLVPDILIPVESWPLTASGQVDPDALPELPAPDASTGGHQPWDDEFERLLRAVLPALPDDAELTADAELAVLGLNSLSTVELLISLEHLYDVSIPGGRLVLDMFETPATLWEGLNRLRAAQPEDAGVTA
ncbi:condensation domain-containing protein [Solwaraspora sp. WMMD1047]|uniref:condensation domain-containing protein n=1 Tax=Solwaraspora sp. WMMD1047 TaxID=3016102 RepID=UPI0024168194|nr:condensation domain-containing protein [Solwaraspora sp. WMMD1047]MDG4830679.1 condensation domain-containing protein [Solwaraspora sp. WMMD1047]